MHVAIFVIRGYDEDEMSSCVDKVIMDANSPPNEAHADGIVQYCAISEDVAYRERNYNLYVLSPSHSPATSVHSGQVFIQSKSVR